MSGRFAWARWGRCLVAAVALRRVCNGRGSQGHKTLELEKVQRPLVISASARQPNPSTCLSSPSTG
jgi:hypothetical protein